MPIFQQPARGDPITIYGQGQQTRSFCYVDDMIDGLRNFMAAGDDVTGPVNLGNPDEFTVLQLAERVLMLSGSTSKLVFQPIPQDDPRQRKPDIEVAKKLINWRPAVTLEDGLVKTIAYFEKLLTSKNVLDAGVN